MTNPTHYIEIYRDIRKPDNVAFRTHRPRDIKNLSMALKATAAADTLKTVAVFLIKEKKKV